MTAFHVARGGVILAVTQVDRSIAFYRDLLGFDLEARYDDPPYATLARAGIRLSLAEQGHPAEDRPGVSMVAPDDPAVARALLVLEVGDCRAVHAELEARGAKMLAPPYSPPWGGHRFFVRDPDGYLVEVEQPA